MYYVSEHSRKYFYLERHGDCDISVNVNLICYLGCRVHDNALYAEIVGINSFYMDIGLDNYRGARTSKLPNCSNWRRSCSRVGAGQEVPQFSRKESKGLDGKKYLWLYWSKYSFFGAELKTFTRYTDI